jgi:hypothetical protein
MLRSSRLVRTDFPPVLYIYVRSARTRVRALQSLSLHAVWIDNGIQAYSTKNRPVFGPGRSFGEPQDVEITIRQRHATVGEITFNSEDRGAVVMPLYGGLVGARVSVTTISYRIETEDTTYFLVLVNRSWQRRDHPLNLTLHGKTKIALDKNGHDAHILDHAGKDVKVPISMKVANTKQEGAHNP